MKLSLRKKHLLVNILVCAWVFGTPLSAKKTNMLNTPNFEIPELEKAYADSMILMAQKKGDVDLMVASLQRWGLSMVELDKQNVDSIVTRIREVRQKEKRVDAQVLLCLLEAQFDYSADVYQKALSFGKKRLLRYRVEDYPNSLWQGNAMGRRCLPTLFDLIKQQQYEVWPSYIDIGPSFITKYKAGLWQDWTSDYAQALRLSHLRLDQTNRYLVDDYLAKHPNTPLATKLQNNIGRLERKYCVVHETKHNFSSHQPIQVKVKSRNVPDLTILVREERSDSVVLRQDFSFDSFKPYEENDTVISLSTLPLGHYYLQRIAPDCSTDSDDERKIFAVTDHFPMLVSRRSTLTEYFKHGDTLVSDLWTGAPIDDAKVDTFGTFSVGLYDNRRHLNECREKQKVLSDLSAYHPGEQVRWLWQVWKESLSDKQVAANYEAKAYLVNPGGQRIDSLVVKTDDWGVCSGTFQLPKGGDMPRGKYKVLVEKPNKWEEFNYVYWHRTETAFDVYDYDSQQQVLEAFPINNNSWGEDTIVFRYRLYSIEGNALPDKPIRVSCDNLDTCVYTNENGEVMLPITQQMLIGTMPKDPCLKYDICFYVKASAAGLDNEKTSVGQWVYFLPGYIRDVPPPPQPDIYEDEAGVFEMKEEDCVAENGSATFRFETKVADVHLYYLVTNHKGEKQRGWLHYEQPGCHTLTFPLANDSYNSFMSLCLAGVYHGMSGSQIACATYAKPVLNVDMNVGGDSLVVGTRQHCQLQVKYEDGTPAIARVMVLMKRASSVLSDNHRWSLEQNRWQSRKDFEPLGRIITGHSGDWERSFWGYDNYREMQDSVRIELPVLQMWGQKIAPDVRHYYGLSPFPGKRRCPYPMLMLERDALRYYNCHFDPDERSTRYGEKKYHGPLFGEDVTSVALYETELVTMPDGTVDLDFDVPNEEGLWELKVIAFDHNMNLVETTKQIVTKRYGNKIDENR